MTLPTRRAARSPLVLGLITLVALVAIGGAAGLAYLFLSIEDHGTMEFQLHFRHA